MQEFITQLLQNYPLIAPIIFIILRSLTVIFPVVPGIVLDAVGIAIFGWKLGFIYAEIGTVGGAIAAFYIARYFREPLVRRFVILQKLDKWEQEISERKKFWTFVSFRLVTGPLLFDYINYAAGLTRIQPLKFFLATLLSSLPIMFSVYYFGDIMLSQSMYLLIILILIIFILAKVQKRWYQKQHIENIEHDKQDTTTT